MSVSTEGHRQHARPRIWGLVVGLLALSVLAAGCGGGVERDEDGTIATRQSIPVTDLEVGDCFDLPAGDEVENLDAVPCEEPHDAEVFHIYDLQDADTRPDPTTLAESNRDACVPAFERFVGFDFDTSELDILTFDPSDDSWAAGDRTVICSLVEVDRSPLTGSAEGAAR
jgi:hypothetical protein